MVDALIHSSADAAVFRLPRPPAAALVDEVDRRAAAARLRPAAAGAAAAGSSSSASLPLTDSVQAGADADADADAAASAARDRSSSSSAPGASATLDAPPRLTTVSTQPNVSVTTVVLLPVMFVCK